MLSKRLTKSNSPRDGWQKRVKGINAAAADDDDDDDGAFKLTMRTPVILKCEELTVPERGNLFLLNI